MPSGIIQPDISSTPLVEVLDLARRAVAVLPAAEVLRQKLCHRAVAILLFDEQGRLHLRRQADTAGSLTGRWDTTARGAVRADEALQDAATRILEKACGVHSERMRPVLELPPRPENNNEFMQVFTLTRSESHVANSHGQDSGEYSFSSEELDCLLRDFRELVSPRFLLLAEAMSLNGLWRRRP